MCYISYEKRVNSHSANETPTPCVVPEWASTSKIAHSKPKIRLNPTPLVGFSRSHYPRVPLVVLSLVVMLGVDLGVVLDVVLRVILGVI